MSERLDYRPASLFVRQVVRPTYACRFCERAGDDPQVVQPPLPPEPIPRGTAAAGLLAPRPRVEVHRSLAAVPPGVDPGPAGLGGHAVHPLRPDPGLRRRAGAAVPADVRPGPGVRLAARRRHAGRAAGPAADGPRLGVRRATPPTRTPCSTCRSAGRGTPRPRSSRATRGSSTPTVTPGTTRCTRAGPRTSAAGCTPAGTSSTPGSPTRSGARGAGPHPRPVRRRGGREGDGTSPAPPSPRTGRSTPARSSRRSPTGWPSRRRGSCRSPRSARP